jgi:hypothetical protein
MTNAKRDLLAEPGAARSDLIDAVTLVHAEHNYVSPL